MSLAAAVGQAWDEVLPGAPANLAWDEAGGDSLALLHFVYRLEQLLGRELSLEYLRTDLDRSAMIAALEAEQADASTGDVRVFLVPGVNGDELGLKRFRSALADRMTFEMVEPLRLEEPARLLTDVVAAGAAAAAEIARRAPAGPLHLAGYSYGGGVALEAAAALHATGRTVALVAVLDTAFGDAVLGKPAIGWQRRLRRRIGRAAARLAAHDRLRRLAIRLVERVAPRRALRVRHAVMHWLRTRARLRWRPTPVSVPVWVAISDEFAPRTAAAWSRQYPHAAIVRIPATHSSLIRGEGLPILVDAFADAVARSRER